MKMTVGSWPTVAFIICIIKGVSSNQHENETISATIKILAISEWRFTDLYATDPFCNLSLFFCEVIDTAQKHFDELKKFSLNITLELDEVLINQNADDQPYVENNLYYSEQENKSVLVVHDVIVELRESMLQLREEEWATQYDFVILFVGRSLLPHYVSSEIFGSAHLPEAGLCNDRPSVDVMITYPNIVAQDIGNFLASGRKLSDFTEQERRECSNELSPPYYAKLTNRGFGFSECLAKMMRSSLTEEKNDCLRTRQPDGDFCKPYIT